MNLSYRLNDAYNQLERLRNPADMAGLLQPKAAKPVSEAVERVVTSIAELRVAIDTALHPRSNGEHLDHKAATDSLAKALEGIAKERRAIRVPADSLRDLVEAQVEAEERPFWAVKSQEGYIRGLIQVDERLKKLLKAAGILAWTNHTDQQIRLVNARWCMTPEEMAAHIESTSVYGYRCRFCLLDELDTGPNLQPVDPDKRKTFDTVNDRYVLNVSTVNTHEACRPFWEEWLGIVAEWRKKHGQ